MTQSLRSRLVAGVLWSGGGRAVALAIHSIVLLVMAAFLSPEHFGLMGLAMVVVNILNGITDLGLGAALIQKAKITDADLDTVFCINVVFGTLLAATLVFLAEPVATVLGNLDAAPLLMSLSLAIPVATVAVVPNSILTRDMNFASLARRDLGGEIAYGFFGIGLAVAGWGVWSLVGAVLAQRMVRAASAWIGIRWRPRVRIVHSSFRELMGFGTYHMLSILALQLLTNADSFVIGRFIGVRALGYYSLAFQLAAVPIQRIAGVLRNVAFPGFAKVRHDPVRMRTAYLTLLQYVSLAALPFSVVMVSGAPVVGLIYGPQWSPAVLPMQMLAVGALFHGISAGDSILLATGKPQWRFGILVLRVGLFLGLTFGIGLHYGMVGVTACMLGSTAVGALATLCALNYLTGARLCHIRAKLAPAFYALLAAGAIGICVVLIGPGTNHATAAIAALGACLVYAACAHRELSQIADLVRASRRRSVSQDA